MVKFQNQPRLMEMEALRPLDKQIAAWPARTDISDDLWRLHRAPDGKRYYVPLQIRRAVYVCAAGLVRAEEYADADRLSTSFLAAAKATTGGDRWGFGMRGGPAGHDYWATFVLGGGAKMVKGGLVTPAALAANHGSSTSSAPRKSSRPPRRSTGSCRPSPT